MKKKYFASFCELLIIIIKPLRKLSPFDPRRSNNQPQLFLNCHPQPRSTSASMYFPLFSPASRHSSRVSGSFLQNLRFLQIVATLARTTAGHLSKIHLKNGRFSLSMKMQKLDCVNDFLTTDHWQESFETVACLGWPS